MSRDYRLFLNDILSAITLIENYAAPYDKVTFVEARLIQDAISMNLVIIGEAARNVPESVQVAHPEIDWRNVVGLRNILVHEYFRTNMERIWDVVKVEMPRLKQGVTELLQEIIDNETGDD